MKTANGVDVSLAARLALKKEFGEPTVPKVRQTKAKGGEKTVYPKPKPDYFPDDPEPKPSLEPAGDETPGTNLTLQFPGGVNDWPPERVTRFFAAVAEAVSAAGAGASYVLEHPVMVRRATS